MITPQGRALSAGLKILAGLVLAVVLLAGLSKVGFHFDPFGLTQRRLAKTQVEAAEAKGAATVAKGEAAAGVAALEAYDRGAARAQRTQQVRQGNSHAILTAPGADAPVDPDLARTFVRGLCHYEAYRDDCGGDRLHEVPGAPEAPR